MSSFNKRIFTNEKELRSARKEFEMLLSQRTEESVWQKFFAEHPYVLSLSLPLRLEPQDIIPLAHPGTSEPDFIFYPKDLTPPPFYGIIEIKRPDSKIVTVTRSNVAILSRDFATAIEQATTYNDTVLSDKIKSNNIVFLGNESYIFVIMGLKSELNSKLGNSVLRDMIKSKLPKNLTLLPYDCLLERFEQKIPSRLYVLAPTLDYKDKEPTDSKESLLKSMDELELSVRTYLALRNAKIHTIADLVQMTEEEMIKTKNFGQRSINEIKEILKTMGLELNMKIEKDKKGKERKRRRL